MIPRYKKIARNAIIVWAISFLILLTVSIPEYPYDQQTIKDIQQLVLLVQGIALLWACGAYAVAKGYSSAVGGLILLFPIGLIILWRLKDKHRDQEPVSVNTGSVQKSALPEFPRQESVDFFTSRSIESRLTELEELKNKRLITQEEYAERREKILENL